MPKCELCGVNYPKLTRHHLHPKPYRNRHNRNDIMYICDLDHTLIHMYTSNYDLEMYYSTPNDLKEYYEKSLRQYRTRF